MSRWDKLLVALLLLFAIVVVVYLAIDWLRKKTPPSAVTSIKTSLLRVNSGLNALAIATLGAWIASHEVLLLFAFFYVLVPATALVTVLNSVKTYGSPRENAHEG